ncbi:MAG: hypothetical protein AAF962_00625 [Actinomycetota bacterium]
MASTIRRPSLAVWQLRLRDRRRRARLATAVLILLVVAAAEVRLAHHRSTAAPSATAPVARIATDTEVGASVGSGVDSSTVPTDGLGPDERAVAISPPLAVPALGPGDRVELVTVGLDSTGRARAETLGRPVRVIEVADDAIVLAVPMAMVTSLLAAQATGPIEAVRLP